MPLQQCNKRPLWCHYRLAVPILLLAHQFELLNRPELADTVRVHFVQAILWQSSPTPPHYTINTKSTNLVPKHNIIDSWLPLYWLLLIGLVNKKDKHHSIMMTDWGWWWWWCSSEQTMAGHRGPDNSGPFTEQLVDKQQTIVLGGIYFVVQFFN